MSAIATPHRRRRQKTRARPRPRPNVAARPRLVRSRAAGRAASFSSYVIVGIVGLLLCGIVTLQIRALQANIDAGKLDNQRRGVLAESGNLRASLAKAHPRSEVEAFAKQAGMIRPDVNAYQTVRVRAK
ncbi:MAG: hypothetical protein QOE98_1850 [Gaiellaceae bacterium]|nr:hypothetical protein [Gaiellaceae bacterium]